MFSIIFITLFALSIASPIDETFYLFPENDRDSRIVGGHPVYIDDHPFIGSLRVGTDTSNRHNCGAVIVSDRTILTAAHCTVGHQASNLRIRFGSTFHAKNETDSVLVQPSSIVNHPNYNPRTLDFDFAVMHLSKPLNFTKQIDKIDLPKQNETFAYGTNSTTCGWGDTRNSSISSDQLRCVNVPLFDTKLCDQAYSGIHINVTDNMVCAGKWGEGGKDACQGDSGGPLYIVHGGHRTLVGLVSWGIGCAEKYYPGVYSRVAAVRHWIDEQIHKHPHDIQNILRDDEKV